MEFNTDRLGALMGLGAGLVLSGLTQTGAAKAAAGPSLEPAGATSLKQLTQTLAAMPRRRDFKTRPMIPDNPDVWDAAALNAVETRFRLPPDQIERYVAGFIAEVSSVKTS